MRNFKNLAILGIALFSLASCQPGNSGNDNPSGIAAANTGTSKIWRNIKACSPTTAPLPGECQDQALCDASTCSDTIVKLHNISVDTFNAMRNYYGDGTLYNGREISKEKIATLVDAAAQHCGDYFIVLNDESAGAHNDSLTFSLQIALITDKIKASYTVAFFKGLLQTYPSADKFVFYKGMHANGCKDIIFTVMEGAEVRYYGDLSDTAP